MLLSAMWDGAHPKRGLQNSLSIRSVENPAHIGWSRYLLGLGRIAEDVANSASSCVTDVGKTNLSIAAIIRKISEKHFRVGCKSVM